MALCVATGIPKKSDKNLTFEETWEKLAKDIKEDKNDEKSSKQSQDFLVGLREVEGLRALAEMERKAGE